MNRKDFEYKMEVALEDWLEENTFDEFLERLGFTPLEIMLNCFDNGLITEEDLKCFMPVDMKD